MWGQYLKGYWLKEFSEHTSRHLKTAQLFPAITENQKACRQLLSTPFKCFMAGPLKELQGFAAKAESGTLS